MQGSATRGIKEGSIVVSSTGRGMSTGQEEVIECPHCHRRHLAICILLIGGCFRCGSTDHFIENFPRESGDSESMQESGRGRSITPPSTRDQGRGRGGSFQHRGRGGIVLETIDYPTPTAPARSYVMRARKDHDAPRVIACNFTLYNTKIHALIDPSSTHSYICIEQLSDKLPSVEPLAYDMLVTSPLGHSVRVNRVYKNCPLTVHDREFSVDLIALPFHKLDLIFGMDWLSKHQAIVDFDKKTVLLKCSDMSKVTVHGIRFEVVSNVISVMQARRVLRKGCEAFLALVLDLKREQVNLEKIPMVKEFLDVFLKELPGIPPEREVDLSIEVVHGTTPISRAPYHMAPTELKELKTQLHELLDKGFIRPSVSP